MRILLEKAELNQQSDDEGQRGPVGDGYLIKIIEPSKGWGNFKIGELWAYRELLYFLVWRDIKIRYKQTVLGVAWAIVQPLFTMMVFSFFFGKLVKIPSNDLPYPIFSYVALIPWTFFANGLSQTSNSLVNNANLISKVYFPRLIIPLSAVFSGLLDFVISMIVFLGIMPFFGIWPTLAIVWLFPLVLLMIAMSLGIGLWLSALNVQYRDVRYLAPFLTQLWLFITPVIYPSSLLSESWRALYGLNPMAGVVEGFRWALLGSSLPGSMVAVSMITAIFILVSGAYYFRQMERIFADIV